jgi:hypothetical protein
MRLRLDGYHARSQSPPGSHSIPDVGADVEAQVAGPDELLVETAEAAHFAGGVVDGE